MAKKRRRIRLKKGPVIVLLLIILLLVFGVIYLYTHTSNYLFFKGLEDTYNYVENMPFIDSYMPYIESNYYNKTNTSFLVKTSEVDTNITFNGDVYFNDKNKYFDLDINANESNYSMELYNKDSKLYFKIDDSKYYYTNYSDINTFSLDGYYDLLSVLIDNLKAGVFKADDVELTINSKKYVTRKIMLILTNEEFKNIMNNFHNDVIKDENLLNVYMSLLGLSTKEELNNYIDNYDVNFDQGLITYSIYFYKNKPIMNEIENGVDGNDRIGIITMDDYFEVRHTTIEDEVSYLKIYDNIIDMFIDGIGYGKGKYDDTSFNIDFTDYSNAPLGNLNYSIKENNNKYNTNFSININLELIKFEISSTNEITIDKNIPNIDLKDTVVIDNMSSDDKKILDEILSFINDIIGF